MIKRKMNRTFLAYAAAALFALSGVIQVAGRLMSKPEHRGITFLLGFVYFCLAGLWVLLGARWSKDAAEK